VVFFSVTWDKELCLSVRRTSVRLGELDERTDPDCYQSECADRVQDFYPSVVMVHKDYDRPKFRNDLALIRLDRPVNITSKYLLHLENKSGIKYLKVDFKTVIIR